MTDGLPLAPGTRTTARTGHYNAIQGLERHKLKPFPRADGRPNLKLRCSFLFAVENYKTYSKV